MIVTVLDRAKRTLLTGAAFLFFFTGGLILSYAVLPILRLGPGTRDEKARRCRLLVGRCWVLFHDYMRLAGIVRNDPRQARFTLPDGPFVLVANHPTLVDVTALVAAIPDIAIVAKSAMFHSLLVGPLLSYCDHIESADGPFAGALVVKQALSRLAQGTPVLIFPEGTRSPRHGIGEFRSGAFEMAARAGVPVVVALIRCEPPTLMRGDPWYAIPAQPSDLTVEQLQTIRVGPGGAAAAALRLHDQYTNLVTAPFVVPQAQQTAPLGTTGH